MQKLSFRYAQPDDIDLLKTWDEKEHVIAADPNDDWNWEVELLRKPAWREMWIASVGDIAIGFIQIIDPQLEDSHYWGEIEAGYRAIDIWIGEEDYLNQGWGTKMMQFAIRTCFAQNEVHSILIDPLASNTDAHRFYKRLGFQFLRAQRFGEDDCFVFELKRI